MKPPIRLFFRSLRVLLGPFMLLWERLSRPTAVTRTEAQQRTLNQQCANIVLYQFKTCPFCIKVRQEIHRLALPIVRCDAQHDAQHRDDLLQGLGAVKVPCLKITDANGKVRWLSESSAIITYLRERFPAA